MIDGKATRPDSRPRRSTPSSMPAGARPDPPGAARRRGGWLVDRHDSTCRVNSARGLRSAADDVRRGRFCGRPGPAAPGLDFSASSRKRPRAACFWLEPMVEGRDARPARVAYGPGSPASDIARAVRGRLPRGRRAPGCGSGPTDDIPYPQRTRERLKFRGGSGFTDPLRPGPTTSSNGGWRRPCARRNSRCTTANIVEAG